ncbi:MAG: hypothetical protein WAQ27_01580 [Candidatus Microsaccharimonas sp.]
MRRLLHLQHHLHTGKKITHKHTSYRGLLLLVAIFGIALFLIHQSVQASEIITSAKVAAPTPSTSAIITSHINEEVVPSGSVPIEGSCAYVAPSTIVELYVDGQFAGSTTCSSGGTFSTMLTLAPGVHQIRLRTVNVTDDYGPDSALFYLTVEAPDESSVPSTPPRSHESTTIQMPQTSQNGIQIYSQSTYLLYGPDKDAEWVGYFIGGEPPYNVAIDWGDGTASSYTAPETASQSFRHTYPKYQPFFVTITVTDSAGMQASMQLAAVTPYIDSSSVPNLLASTELARIDQIILNVGYGTVAVLVLLGILTVYHAEFVYLQPQLTAKQYVSKNTRRRRR